MGYYKDNVDDDKVSVSFKNYHDYCNKKLKNTFGRLPKIESVIFNNPATIIIWGDDSKTVVKIQDGDEFSKEHGLAMCMIKKIFDNKGNYNDVFKKWCK